MNCAEVRVQLTEFTCRDSSVGLPEEIEQHLASCAACQQEAAHLRWVTRLLEATPTPPVHVDVAAVYQAAQRTAVTRGQRWKRLALAAAASLFFVLCLRLECRFAKDQLIVRWGTPLVTAPQPDQTRAENGAKLPPPAPLAQPEALRDLEAIVASLTSEVQRREDHHARSVSELRKELDELRRDTALRTSALERDFSALYQAHLATKGGNP